VRARAVPLVGGGRSVFSFTHVEDAATAMLAALDREAGGVLNIVDDAPAPIAYWLPALAALVGALQPRRLPAAIVRLAIGGWGLAFLTRLRGGDNARARETLNWRPRHSSWRQGFQHEFGQPFPDASGNETVPANAAQSPSASFLSSRSTMSTRTAFPPIRSGAEPRISHIHHVGHVVRDIDGAIALYRRMGFVVRPPSFPALPSRPGEPARLRGGKNPRHLPRQFR